ncbi:MAG: DEAD/DEAH box helicase [Campylobacteraceae bacterium]|jgi:ATP-dependent RNA helicase DeaD|nr:DEAD/DEAH box helicase [Campylobacteraceae bacterium]
MNDFEHFGLHEQVLRAVKEAGFKEPSPIQQEIIPIILSGRDVVGQAQTGTGKTAAFSLPSLSMIDTAQKSVQILVITPTRELATQISDEMYALGRFRNIHTVTVYGGSSYSRQLKLIEQGSNVVVATPGRLLDLLKGNKMYGFEPKIVILDEADEMLDMGFLEDIEAIFAHLPKERQTLLLSATMPEPIKALAKRILNNPAFVSVTPQNATTNADIEQQYYVIEEYERDDAIIRLLDALDPQKAIIFCRTKKEVDRLSTKLISSGFIAKSLHGDMDQPQREEVIKSFRNSDIDILVATDVAARGLNVKEITHVFNYHMPFDPESYVHRIGRTARAGQKGTAITLLTPIEYHSLQRIAKTVGTKLTQKQIPTLFEMKANSAKKLAQNILAASIDSAAVKIVNELEKELDLAQIAYKAISLLIGKSDAKGPNSIGVDSKTFESYIKKAHAKEEEKRSARSRSRNRSSNRGGSERSRNDRSSFGSKGGKKSKRKDR